MGVKKKKRPESILSVLLLLSRPAQYLSLIVLVADLGGGGEFKKSVPPSPLPCP